MTLLGIGSISDTVHISQAKQEDRLRGEKTMLPIICIVGASNSGKTTFLEQLIPELRRRGYRVGTVKHDVHGFEMDREGKDTWRHRHAGARTIAIASPAMLATIRETEVEMPLEELAGRYFWEEDILLTEGYKQSRFPKIEVFRSAIEAKPICTVQDNLLAMVTDDRIDLDVPGYRFDQVAGVAELIVERFLKDRKKRRVMVHVEGKRLPMNDFVEQFFIGGIVGMLSSLRGWKPSREIDIQVRLEDA
jgi:molybdopterin-guanine dinucleotide biosynthesis adapter protein